MKYSELQNVAKEYGINGVGVKKEILIDQIKAAEEAGKPRYTEEKTEETPKIEKKKGTAPGWKPAGQLPKLKAPHGFSAKWASSEPGKLSRLRAEGWQIMKPTDNKGEKIINIDINDSNAVGSELRYRDLVAVMLPIDRKEARDEWLRQENTNAVSSIFDQTDNELSANGVQTYTPKGQSGRIVIE